MTSNRLLLIHPPVVKPSEPPAGIARLAGALRSHGIACTAVDANIEGLLHLLRRNINIPGDTWSRRAYRHMEAHLESLQNPETYSTPDKYRRAVADINRLLSLIGEGSGIRVSLANYEDKRLSPVRSADLIDAARHPERNPYFDYFQSRVLPMVRRLKPGAVGLSVNYLSQALCAFALIGLVKRSHPQSKVILGGGLISSWLNRRGSAPPFSPWVDRMVSGLGESALIEIMGRKNQARFHLPDYDDFTGLPYLSPGFVLPFSTATGCWWRRCRFCPEQSEKAPYRPLARSAVANQLKELTRRTRPALIHLLDNALPPALLKRLAADPPGAPWYGFTRIGPPLNDPDVCRQLAQSGCVMLKLGLESGDQRVLDKLEKGICQETASQVLSNLHGAGIAAYIYLLFGTPADDRFAADKTLQFTVEHHRYVDFLNLAVFNLPIGGSGADDLDLRPFYTGDLQLYSDFVHRRNWHRPAIRRFLENQFKKHPAVQPIIRRTPPIFSSNHAPFFT